MSPRKVIANVFRGLSLVWGAAVLQSGGARSLRVRDDAQEYVGISLDPVVEAPVLVHARLVDAARLVHLLGAQRLVTRVAEKIRELLPEVFLDPPSHPPSPRQALILRRPSSGGVPPAG